MYALMIYSLKAGVCLAVFYLFFKLLLSRETFHRFNRIVVLGAMVLSFALPLCVVTVYRTVPVVPEPAVVPAAAPLSLPAPEPFPWETLAGAAFLAGAAATLLRTLLSLLGVVRLVRRGRRERLEDGAVMVFTDEAVTPFSWGRFIVMPERDRAENGETILLHERAHLRLRHTWDLILTDAAACLQWFNPAMWLLRRELRAIHEYEADAAVLGSGVDAKSYQLLLIRKAVGGRWYSVANSFNHSKLKNRITMMLRKKSSRWAATRALLLLPLTGLAVGAFARTAYVFEEDKGKKENVTIRIMGRNFSSEGTRPLILVDGIQVASLDSLPADRIESITVLKDSVSAATYGEQGTNGVILVTLKKAGQAGDSVRIPGLKGRAVKISRKNTSGTNDLKNVRVIGYGTVPKNAAADSMPTFVMKGRNVKINGSESKPVYVVDGVRIDGIESLDPQSIERISVVGGSRTPRKQAEKGYDSVVEITTRLSSEAQKIYRESMEQGMAGLEAARKGLEQAREFMSSEAWKEAQQALAKARQDLEAARREREAFATRKSGVEVGATEVSAAGEEARITLKGRDSEVTLSGEQENSVSVYKGRVTLKDGFPDGMLIRINGRKASKADVERLEPGQIKRMTVYKGDEALKRYGEEGRRGAVEIRARR